MLKFNDFEWKTEPPTQEGWYWAKTENGTYLFNLENNIGADPLYFESTGMYWQEGMDTYKITHWLGPLPVPEPPKE